MIAGINTFQSTNGVNLKRGPLGAMARGGGVKPNPLTNVQYGPGRESDAIAAIAELDAPGNQPQAPAGTTIASLDQLLNTKPGGSDRFKLAMSPVAEGMYAQYAAQQAQPAQPAAPVPTDPAAGVAAPPAVPGSSSFPASAGGGSPQPMMDPGMAPAAPPAAPGAMGAPQGVPGQDPMAQPPGGPAGVPGAVETLPPQDMSSGPMVQELLNDGMDQDIGGQQVGALGNGIPPDMQSMLDVNVGDKLAHLTKWASALNSAFEKRALIGTVLGPIAGGIAGHARGDTVGGIGRGLVRGIGTDIGAHVGGGLGGLAGGVIGGAAGNPNLGTLLGMLTGGVGGGLLGFKGTGALLGPPRDFKRQSNKDDTKEKPEHETAETKSAWQDNSGPRLSATGESTNLGFEHRPGDYARGPAALDSMTQFMRQPKKFDPFKEQSQPAKAGADILSPAKRMGMLQATKPQAVAPPAKAPLQKVGAAVHSLNKFMRRPNPNRSEPARPNRQPVATPRLQMMEEHLEEKEKSGSSRLEKLMARRPDLVEAGFFKTAGIGSGIRKAGPWLGKALTKAGPALSHDRVGGKLLDWAPFAAGWGGATYGLHKTTDMGWGDSAMIGLPLATMASPRDWHTAWREGSQIARAKNISAPSGLLEGMKPQLKRKLLTFGLSTSVPVGVKAFQALNNVQASTGNVRASTEKALNTTTNIDQMVGNLKADTDRLKMENGGGSVLGGAGQEFGRGVTEAAREAIHGREGRPADPTPREGFPYGTDPRPAKPPLLEGGGDKLKQTGDDIASRVSKGISKHVKGVGDQISQSQPVQHLNSILGGVRKWGPWAAGAAAVGIPATYLAGKWLGRPSQPERKAPVGARAAVKPRKPSPRVTLKRPGAYRINYDEDADKELPKAASALAAFAH